MSRRKLDAKAFSQQKRRRRNIITFVRMCRYGVNNFSRNAWLTVAATAVMTVTLLVVFVTVAAHNVLIDTLNNIKNQVSMSIYVNSNISASDVTTIKKDLSHLSSVTSVTYISPDQARQNFAESKSTNVNILQALNDAGEGGSNIFPGAFRVNVTNINNTAQLQHFVTTNPTIKADLSPSIPPSFDGDKRVAISNIGRAITFGENIGLGASILFIAISSLIVFNTIRMAIFNRKEEIQMMKLIGADRSFIRGPFVVEAIVYGFIAAIVATGLGTAVLLSTHTKLEQYGVSMGHTIHLFEYYIAFVLLGMILLGALIGTVSSLLATRRYLKI